MKSFKSMIVVLGFLVTGCATISPIPAPRLSTAPPPEHTLPSVIRQAPTGDLQLAQARDNIRAYTGTPVRWGGTIVAVENEDRGIRIEVQEHQLDSHGQPQPDSATGNRFIARASVPFDPEIYAEGQEITIAGSLIGAGEGLKDQQRSMLPLVEAKQHYVWYQDYRRSYPSYSPRYHYRRPYHSYSSRFHYRSYPRFYGGYSLGFHYGPYPRFRYRYPSRFHYRLGYGWYGSPYGYYGWYGPSHRHRYGLYFRFGR